MPKKGKKGGKKGKGKGKKGKSGKKTKDESIEKQAIASSKVWEARVTALEDTKNEFRDNANKFAVENELLSNHMKQTEQDTIEIIKILRQQDQSKEDQIDKLEAEIKSLKKQNRQEKQVLIDDYNTQISEMEALVKKRGEDIALMQNELRHVKEFRRKRAQMQRELDDIKDEMFTANRSHKEEMSRMEQKFLEEKMMIQKEANQKIAELADRAHQEAISNLDESTRSVYKENVRLSEAMKYHTKEEERLRKKSKRLDEDNEVLRAEKDNLEKTLLEKVAESGRQSKKIRDLEDKVDSLEMLLNHMVRQFEESQKDQLEQAAIASESSFNEIVKLQRTVDMKTKEMAKVKKLARSILLQRTEIERFFLDSLEDVKKEITQNQIEYKRAAEAAYNSKMREAFQGKGTFPKIRTFQKSDFSTNSVFKDLEAAEKLPPVSSFVDIAELTWEQKEKVLRYLFARMNGAQPTMKTDSSTLPSAQQLALLDGTFAGKIDPNPANDDKTFLTQAGGEADMASLNKHSVIPGIGQPTQQQLAM